MPTGPGKDVGPSPADVFVSDVIVATVVHSEPPTHQASHEMTKVSLVDMLFIKIHNDIIVITCIGWGLHKTNQSDDILNDTDFYLLK